MFKFGSASTTHETKNIHKKGKECKFLNEFALC